MAEAEVHWEGPEATELIIQALKDALTEIGLRIESEAKKQLYPGHGKVTGTLQRSIHAASPNHPFQSENVTPDRSTPERGQGRVEPELRGDTLWVAVGTGMEYALFIHTLYQYLTTALNMVAPQAMGIVERHTRQYRA